MLDDYINAIERKLRNFDDYVKQKFNSLHNYIFRYNMSLWHPIRKIEPSDNELIKIIEAFPKAMWDWDDLTKNPNITPAYIEKHPKFSWNLRYLSLNPNINIDYVLSHPEIDWSWPCLSQNPGISLRVIEEYPDLNWNWQHIGKHPYLTIEFILEHEIELLRSPLGSSQNITIEDIENNPDLEWCDEEIAKNPNITIDFVLRYFGYNYNYNWNDIGTSPMITFDDIIKYPFLLDNQNFIGGFSKNPNITTNIIKKNGSLFRECGGIYYNPAISMEDLKSLHGGWYNKEMASNNPNITLEWIKENPKWCNFNKLSHNPFNCHPYFNKEIVIKI